MHILFFYGHFFLLKDFLTTSVLVNKLKRILLYYIYYIRARNEEDCTIVGCRSYVSIRRNTHCSDCSYVRPLHLQ